MANGSPLSWLPERTARLMQENAADLTDEAADARWGKDRD